MTIADIKKKVTDNKVTLGLAATGAVIGTAVMPGVGTAIGAGIGAVIGWWEKNHKGNSTTSNPTTDDVVHLLPIKMGPKQGTIPVIHLLKLKMKPTVTLTPTIIKEASQSVLKDVQGYTFTNDSLGLNKQVAVAALDYLINNPNAVNLAACINTLGKNKSPEAQDGARELTNLTAPDAIQYWK